MATNTNANIGFEKQIWDAACVLRGNMDASEYKSVVLGLIFLSKYISDRFEAKYQRTGGRGRRLRGGQGRIHRREYLLRAGERPLEA